MDDQLPLARAFQRAYEAATAALEADTGSDSDLAFERLLEAYRAAVDDYARLYHQAVMDLERNQSLLRMRRLRERKRNRVTL